MMPNFLNAVHRAVRSRFWLTLATLWLCGWLAIGSGHSLLHECGTAQTHCGNTPLPAHSQPESSCLLCQFGNLPLVLPSAAWQLVSVASLSYFVLAQPVVEVEHLHQGNTPISRRGPPFQLIFA
jgi:hypothetical protein